MPDKHRHAAKTSNKSGYPVCQWYAIYKGARRGKGVSGIWPGLAGITWLAQEAGAEDESETKGWKKQSRGVGNYRDR